MLLSCLQNLCSDSIAQGTLDIVLSVGLQVVGLQTHERANLKDSSRPGGFCALQLLVSNLQGVSVTFSHSRRRSR